MPTLPASALGIFLATFGFALAGGIIPFLSIEAYVLALSATSPHADTLPVALAASLGQMAAKSLVYLTGRGVVRLPFPRTGDRIRAVASRLARVEGGAMAIVLTSAVTSMPPFYTVSLAAGALRLRFAQFFAVGCAGGFLRFATLFTVPRLFP
jgi:membrane protein YqaA with SNARE-associated domain